MTTPASTPEPASPEPRRRRSAPARASDADVLALVERAARVADGFALLQRAPLECIAVLLGVAPGAVERVRVALEDPARCEEAARQFARATAARRAEPPAPPRALAPRDPDQLLAAARRRPGGLDLLLAAAPEAAAVAFGVHPDVVHGARAAAALAGLSGDVPS